MRWFPLVLLSVALLVGCGKKAGGPASEVPEVSIVSVTPQDVPVTYEFVGQTQSSRQVQIVARVNGFLDRRVYTEGTLVKAGQVMFLQDAKPFRATLSAARGALAQEEARLQTARDNLARVRPLTEQNALSQKDLDDATGQEQAAAAAVETARANVDAAELNLGYTTIVSPVTGLSSFSRVQEGTYLNPENSLLTYVAQVDPVWVNFSLSENEVLDLRREQSAGRMRAPEDRMYEVQIVLADGTVYDKKGRITFADAEYSAQTGTFLVRATLPNADAVLRPGQFVRVRVLGLVRPQAIVVPQAAVANGATGHFVWIIDKDDKAQIRAVEVGPWHGDGWFITSGLSAGERVAVSGTMKLGPGVAVKVADGAAR